MSIIPPTHAEAARLRATFAGNPIVRQAVDALDAFRGPLGHDQTEAASLLPLWAHCGELSEREALAVVAMFDPPAVECPTCHARGEAEALAITCANCRGAQ